MKLFLLASILLIAATNGQGPVIGGIICGFIRCPPGNRCQTVNFVPRCVPVTTTRRPTTRPTPRPPGCNLFCFTRAGCGLVYPAFCPPGCQPRPQCLDVNNCRNHWCPLNQECALVQVTCVRPPCNPIAQCRPRRIGFPWPFSREGLEGSGDEGPTCGDSDCKPPAECALVKPMSCENEQGCPLKPECIEENACDLTDCKEGFQCVLKEANCDEPPCNPVAECVPQHPDPDGPIPATDPEASGSPDEKDCKENETFSNCKTNCSDTNCNEEPVMCPQVCIGTGCVCHEGFFRDESGKCVTQKDCELVKGVNQP